MTTYHWFKTFDIEDNKWYTRNKQNMYTIITIVQYTIPESVPFIVQSQKNDNEINIDHKPSQFWLYNNQ